MQQGCVSTGNATTAEGTVVEGADDVEGIVELGATMVVGGPEPVLILAILLPSGSVNQMLPSGPVVISNGPLLVPARIGDSVKTPFVDLGGL